jgi:multidrug efflux pump subunit AcrA (membrane-fusion protein)
MKHFGILILAVCVLAAGCSTAPEIRAAHAKQQEALKNLKANLETFSDAALKDLEAALVAQIDAEFAARRAAMIDAEGKVMVADYDRELAAAQAARDRDRAKVAAQFAKFREIEQDLDGSIAVGEAMDRYLNRKTFTTQDAVNLMQEVAAILQEK